MRLLLLSGLVAVLAACSGGSPCEPATPGCLSPTNEVVGGVDLTRLFDAPLSVPERAAVQAAWASRQAAAASARPRLAAVATGTDATGAGLTVYAAFPSDPQAPADTLFIAVVRNPRRASGDVRLLPAVLVFPDTPPEADATTLLSQVPLSADLSDQVILVLVAPRGQGVRVGPRLYGASAPVGVPYVTDVDDAESVLARIEPLALRLDPTRVAAMGTGRGGTTALLLAARTTGIDLAVALGAPTSFLLPSVRADARRYLLGLPLNPGLPALDAVFAATLDRVRTGQLSIAEARVELLARSPGPFVEAPPRILAAHGGLDEVVPPEQLAGLVAAGTQPEVVTIRNPEDHHTTLVRAGNVVSVVSVWTRERLGPF